ncbi:MAG: hypothetical protein AAFU85_19810 [Planctomycetota bacterium]
MTNQLSFDLRQRLVANSRLHRCPQRGRYDRDADRDREAHPESSRPALQQFVAASNCLCELRFARRQTGLKPFASLICISQFRYELIPSLNNLRKARLAFR